MTITANDLKTRGVTIIDDNLKNDDRVFVSVRGKRKYVVMDIAHYEYLREMELTAAAEEARKDITAGRYTTDISTHLKEIQDAL